MRLRQFSRFPSQSPKHHQARVAQALDDRVLLCGEKTDLVAKSFDIGLRELLALAQLLDPAIDLVLHEGVFCGLKGGRWRGGSGVVGSDERLTNRRPTRLAREAV